MKKSRFQHPVMRRFNHLWQAALVYLFTLLFWALPLEAASGLGGWIGRNIGPRLGISKRARKNLDYIFPEKTDFEKKEIIAEMWDNLGRVTAESPHLATLRHPKYTTVEGGEYLERETDEIKPIMMLSGHFANWEMGSVVAGARGHPLAIVYRRPNNPYVDRLVRWMRLTVTEAVFTKGPEGARGMMRWLREGRTVGLLVDQKMNEGVEMPFVGKPAMTGIVPAQLSLMTGALMLPIAFRRVKGTHFEMIVHPPLQTDPSLPRDEQVLDLTRQMNDFLSDHIRRYPGQWLWLHRRWIGV